VAGCRNHEVFPRFPPAASTDRHPLLSTGFPEDKFPGFGDTMECSDALWSLRPHFVAFAWPYLIVCSVFRSRRCRVRQGRAWGWFPVSPSGCNVRRRQGLPGSQGDPWCLCLVLRPRRNRRQQAITLVRHGSRLINDESYPRLSTFEAQWQASALAVYASQDGSLHHHAILASGGWPSLTGGGWLPTGSLQKVSELYLLHPILLLQAFLAQ
jgi:hypothetical protein